MSADQEVIRSFLVSLGFTVDQTGARKFLGALGGVGKVALATGTAVASVAVAAEVMVKSFTNSMEKLYYASKRTNASVENIQALESGAQRVGVQAGVAQTALESMSAAMRMNPGLAGMLSSFGIKSEGVDRMHVMMQLVQQLSKMPHYVGAQFAQMFGMDEQTFLMMKMGLPEMLAAEERRIALNKKAGIDAQKAAESSKEYANSLRDVSDRIGVLKDKIGIELLPTFRKFNAVVNDGIDKLMTLNSTDISNLQEQLTGDKTAADDLRDSFFGLVYAMQQAAESKEGTKFFNSIKDSAQGAALAIANVLSGMMSLVHGDTDKGLPSLWSGVKGAVYNSPGGFAVRKMFEGINEWRDSFNPGGSRSESPYNRLVSRPGNPMPTAAQLAANTNSSTPTTTAQAFLAGLEGKYKLPDGIMDRIWGEESGRGRKMLSPKGAKGHFGFMDPTAKQYGVSDPNDFNQSAEGSAHYLSDLLKKYGGNVQMMAAAYNWGPGNLDKYGLGRAPSETRKYVNDVAGDKGTTINQETNITVSGTDKPQETAKAIGREQERVNAAILRNTVGAAR